MITLQNILDSFLSSSKLKQRYIEKVKNSVNKKSIDWEERAKQSSKSMIAAVCFKETANSFLIEENNLVYSSIGFYYSNFHLSLALLKLD